MRLGASDIGHVIAANDVTRLFVVVWIIFQHFLRELDVVPEGSKISTSK
jgi:hypothetical protein